MSHPDTNIDPSPIKSEVKNEVASSPSEEDTQNEKLDEKVRKDGASIEVAPSPTVDDSLTDEKGIANENHIIITGADAAKYLLPMRDDGEPALTFRSLFLSTLLCAFQAAMNQIYQVSKWCLVNFYGMLIIPSVETDSGHHSGHFHRPNCVFPGQSMGELSPPW